MTLTSLLLRPFPYLGSMHQVVNLHFLRSCASSILLLLLHVFSYNITPPQFLSSCLSVPTHFHLPCSHCYIFFSLSLHMASQLSHLCLPHLLSSVLIFSILFFPVSTFLFLFVPASFDRAAFLSANVSPPYIRTGLMMVFYTGAMESTYLAYNH